MTPFGTEYGLCSRWQPLERWYVRTFGLVDLPTRLRARLVMKKLRGRVGHRVLDFGSGTGCYAFYLSRDPQVLVTAVDVDDGRILECQRITRILGRQNADFRTMVRGEDLEVLPTETFDAVLLVEVLQYTPDPGRVMSQLSRVLRGGGRLVGHIPMLGHVRPHETRLFDDVSLSNLLRESGLEIESIEPTFGGPAAWFCRLYQLSLRSRWATGLLYPLLLSGSFLVPVKCGSGSYRLFVARKPLSSSS